MTIWVYFSQRAIEMASANLEQNAWVQHTYVFVIFIQIESE